MQPSLSSVQKEEAHDLMRPEAMDSYATTGSLLFSLVWVEMVVCNKRLLLMTEVYSEALPKRALLHSVRVLTLA
jgi:hypothetical protein